MIKITSDSTADLDYLFNKHSISVMPLYVTMDGRTYRDGVDINPEMIFQTFDEKKVLPKTAAPGIEEHEDFFKEHLTGAEALIHFCISSELSVTCRNAQLAAEKFDNVYVVDSRSLSTGIGLLILKAIDLRDKGMSAQDIFNRINELVPFVQASFMVENLLFLHKGGRCSAATRLIAGVLKIRPVLVVTKEGKIEAGQKFLGSFIKNIGKYVESMVRTHTDLDYTRVFITHAGADDDKIEETKIQIRKHAPQFKEILVTSAGSTVSSHCGRGTLGILFINKSDQT